MHPRIERSTRPGEYVGYAHGAQRIRRCAAGWETYALGSAAGTALYLTGRTLHDLGEALERAAQADPPPQ